MHSSLFPVERRVFRLSEESNNTVLKNNELIFKHIPPIILTADSNHLIMVTIANCSLKTFLQIQIMGGEIQRARRKVYVCLCEPVCAFTYACVCVCEREKERGKEGGGDLSVLQSLKSGFKSSSFNERTSIGQECVCVRVCVRVCADTEKHPSLHV